MDLNDIFMNKIIKLIKKNWFVYFKNNYIISPFISKGGYIDIIKLHEQINSDYNFYNIDNEDLNPEFYPTIDKVDVINNVFDIINNIENSNPIETDNSLKFIEHIKNDEKYNGSMYRIGGYYIFLKKFLFNKYNKGDLCRIDIYYESEYSIIVDIVITKTKLKNIEIHRILRYLY